MFMTTSIGISQYPADREDQEALIKHADTAMYLRRELGGNKDQFYTPMLEGVALEKSN
jgi:GGDEF domain-containing protein